MTLLRQLQRLTQVALIVALATAGASPALAALPQVTAITIREGAEEIQMAITATGPVHYQSRNVRPNWVVVDILGAEIATPAPSVPGGRGLVQKIRVGQYMPDVVRVVIELIGPAKFHLTLSPDSTSIIVGISSDAGTNEPPSEHGQSPAARAAAPIVSALIVPGQRVGSLRLGMTIQDVVAVLGPSLHAEPLPNGDVAYRWFKSPGGSGLGVQVTAAGVVNRISIFGDERYVTGKRLHVGSTEADARAVLGDPSWIVTVDSRTKMKTLMYESLGVWINIQLDVREPLYNRIFEIDIVRPK